MAQADTTQSVNQHVGHCRERHPQLIEVRRGYARKAPTGRCRVLIEWCLRGLIFQDSWAQLLSP
jgi:hypothetical protein